MNDNYIDLYEDGTFEPISFRNIGESSQECEYKINGIHEHLDGFKQEASLYVIVPEKCNTLDQILNSGFIEWSLEE